MLVNNHLRLRAVARFDEIKIRTILFLCSEILVIRIIQPVNKAKFGGRKFLYFSLIDRLPIPDRHACFGITSERDTGQFYHLCAQAPLQSEQDEKGADNFFIKHTFNIPSRRTSGPA